SRSVLQRRNRTYERSAYRSPNVDEGPETQSPAPSSSLKQNAIRLPRSIQSHPSEMPMFQQLVPLLRQRSVLLTVTSLEEDQIRVNVVPKKLADGENVA